MFFTDFICWSLKNSYFFWEFLLFMLLLKNSLACEDWYFSSFSLSCVFYLDQEIDISAQKT